MCWFIWMHLSLDIHTFYKTKMFHILYCKYSNFCCSYNTLPPFFWLQNLPILPIWSSLFSILLKQPNPEITDDAIRQEISGVPISDISYRIWNKGLDYQVLFLPNSDYTWCNMVFIANFFSALFSKHIWWRHSS